MAAGWLVLRAEFRARWRTWLMLALIAGLFAGAVEAAAAGARRTDAAYPGLLAWSRPPDVLLFSFPGRSPAYGRFPAAAAARLPLVTQAAALTGYLVARPADLEILAPASTAVPSRFWHRKLLAGRLADPARADEVNISFSFAETARLRVGDTLRASLMTLHRQPRSLRLRIVGVDAAPAEFPPLTGTGSDIVWATPAFYREHRSGLTLFSGLALRLRHGAADLPALQRPVSRLAGGKLVQAFPLSAQAAGTEHSIHLQAVALWLVSGLLGLIGLLTVGQLLARQSFLDATRHGTLVALGMSRPALLGVGLARAAVIGAGGAVAGALLAVAVSPLFPMGLARVAETQPGVHADGTVLGLGLAGSVLALMTGAAWPAWRAARAGRPRSRAAVQGAAGPAAARASRRASGAPGVTWGLSSVSAVIGIRLALQPGAGRTALPVRSTIASAVVGVAALAAALVFAASLGNLLATPRLYGVTWNADVTNIKLSGVTTAARSMAGDAAVAAWATGYSGVPLSVGGTRADALALRAGHRGSLQPVLTEGHLPRGPSEIAVGARTLATMHARLGAVVAVSLGTGPAHRFRLVGTAIFPTLSDNLGLGHGAAVTVAGLRALLPPGLRLPSPDTLLVRFRPAAASSRAQLNGLAAREARLGPFITQGPAVPTDVVNFGQVQELPLLLGTALSLLAVLTIAHLLGTSVRRRRRDFAVLRALGFTRRQVRHTVGWQAGALTAAALALGLPLGILGGRVAWRAFAHQLGILPAVIVPLATLALLVPAALALAVAVAAGPGESAARARTAQILRSE